MKTGYVYIGIFAFSVFLGSFIGPIIGVNLALREFEKSQKITQEQIERNNIADERVENYFNKRVQKILLNLSTQKLERYKAKRDYYIKSLEYHKVITEAQMWEALSDE